jgi:hypothetical protein
MMSWQFRNSSRLNFAPIISSVFFFLDNWIDFEGSLGYGK